MAVSGYSVQFYSQINFLEINIAYLIQFAYVSYIHKYFAEHWLSSTQF